MGLRSQRGFRDFQDSGGGGFCRTIFRIFEKIMSRLAKIIAIQEGLMDFQDSGEGDLKRWNGKNLGGPDSRPPSEL